MLLTILIMLIEQITNSSVYILCGSLQKHLFLISNNLCKVFATGLVFYEKSPIFLNFTQNRKNAIES